LRADPPGLPDILPHLDAAYDLARWLTGNDADAADVVQESCVRAIRYAAGYRGGNPRAWLLAIVRNAAWSWLERQRGQSQRLDPEVVEAPAQDSPPADDADELAHGVDRELLARGLASLPPEFREVLVLREFSGLSYQEIAATAGIPMGTVMSRLARARAQLRAFLVAGRRR
jgi:RNA polymerase sigma-70 factor (ECF subfamily)